MAFYVGQKVVCVEPDTEIGPQFLEKGAIYTIASTHAAGQGVKLVEVSLRGWLWRGFRATRFRPITERKTSIEIFKAMLNPSKTEVTA